MLNLTATLPNKAQIATLASMGDGAACVLPGTAIDDVADGCSSNAVGFRKLIIALTSDKPFSDIHNHIRGQYGAPVLRSATVKSMSATIFPIAYGSVPSQIIDLVVGVITVVVASLHSWGARTYKSLQHKSMNQSEIQFLIARKSNPELQFAPQLFQEMRSSCSFPAHLGFPRAYMAEGAHFVIGKAINLFPYFVHCHSPYRVLCSATMVL